MKRIYDFATAAIEAGETVLVYWGVTDPNPVPVTSTGRLSLSADRSTMFLDGLTCKGRTIAIKPRGRKI